MRIGVLSPVAEIEGIVEIRRVPALGVLEHGLEPVDPLGEARFGGRGGIVFVPECKQSFRNRRGQVA